MPKLYRSRSRCSANTGESFRKPTYLPLLIPSYQTWVKKSRKNVDFTNISCYNGKVLRIYKSEVFKGEIEEKDYKPGEIAGKVKNTGIIVKTGDGYLLITEMQPENGKRMNGQAFLCGVGRNCVGIIFADM